MKLNRLESHDRLLHLKKDQSASIQDGASDCLTKNPLSLALQDRSPYVYLYAHPRTELDGVTKKMYWQPRLGKPFAEPNSYLFRAQSKTDIVEVCWLLPSQELWGEHKKGNVTESQIVMWSIDQYLNNKKELEKPYPDDFSQDRIKSILMEIAREMEEDIRIRKWTMPKTLEVF